MKPCVYYNIPKLLIKNTRTLYVVTEFCHLHGVCARARIYIYKYIKCYHSLYLILYILSDVFYNIHFLLCQLLHTNVCSS
jgi:hypothetical protein